MGIQELVGHTYTGNRWTCRKEMDMQEEDGHAGRRWTCRKKMDIREWDGHASSSLYKADHN